MFSVVLDAVRISIPTIQYHERLPTSVQFHVAKINTTSQHQLSSKFFDPIRIKMNQSRDEVIQDFQQRLVLLNHASICLYSNNPAVSQKCRYYRNCSEMQQLLKHTEKCDKERCEVHHCLSTRYLISHKNMCTEDCCMICKPLKDSIQRKQKRNHDVVMRVPQMTSSLHTLSEDSFDSPRSVMGELDFSRLSVLDRSNHSISPSMDNNNTNFARVISPEPNSNRSKMHRVSPHLPPPVPPAAPTPPNNTTPNTIQYLIPVPVRYGIPIPMLNLTPPPAVVTPQPYYFYPTNTSIDPYYNAYYSSQVLYHSNPNSARSMRSNNDDSPGIPLRGISEIYNDDNSDNNEQQKEQEEVAAEKKVAELVQQQEQQENNSNHNDYTCTHCQDKILSGFRYHCAICSIDVCTICFHHEDDDDNTVLLPHSHPLRAIRIKLS